MVGVCPDGYVAFCFGPYSAKDNDASILVDVFESFHSSLNKLEPGDVFYADRGFRDSSNLLESTHQFNIFTPRGDTKKQQSTVDANYNRFISKVRWQIEATFGRLKQKFKYLAQTAHNSTLIYDAAIIEIGFALLNKFHEPIHSDVGRQDVVIQLMRSRFKEKNLLQSIVEAYNLSMKRVVFQDVPYPELSDDDMLQLNSENVTVLEFPKLNLEDLQLFSCGVFQLNMSPSYYALHTLSSDGLFKISKYVPPKNGLIDWERFNLSYIVEPVLYKARMASRFIGNKERTIFILIDKAKVGLSAIISYYCTCGAGSRTVGCCSHVMCITWFMSYGYCHNILSPNADLHTLFLRGVPLRERLQEIERQQQLLEDLEENESIDSHNDDQVSNYDGSTEDEDDENSSNDNNADYNSEEDGDLMDLT